MNVVRGCLRKTCSCSVRSSLPRRFARAPAIRALLQLQPPLVGAVLRIPERCRVGRMNQDRDAEFPGLCPERIESRIVHGHAPARAVGDVHAEVLEDLETLRAIPHVRLELRRGPCGKARIVDALVGRVREDHEPVRMRSLQRPYGLLQPHAVAAGEVHEHGHVEGIHRAHELGHACGRHLPPEVIVHVHEREPRSRHRMLGHLQGRAGFVFLEAHVLRMKRTHQQACDHSHPPQPPDVLHATSRDRAES